MVVVTAEKVGHQIQDASLLVEVDLEVVVPEDILELAVPVVLV